MLGLEPDGELAAAEVDMDPPANHRRIRRERKMIMGKKSIERLMTLPELSEMLGVPIETLYGWRHRGEGPVGHRIGRHVRYRRAQLRNVWR